MRLTDLDPKFLRLEGEREFATMDEASIAEADGITFLCPKCFLARGGKAGTHSIICWQPHVPAEIGPGPGRWKFSGTGMADLTLSASSSSILLTGGCGAHFYIQQGDVRMA